MGIKRGVALSAILILSAMATGCILVRGDLLQPPAKWPLDKPSGTKSIALVVKPQIESGTPSDRAEKITHLVEGQAQKAYTDSTLFTQVSVKTEPSDVIADIRTSEDSNNALNFISGFICGYSMGIIPAYGKATVTMQTVFRDASGKEIGSINKSESVSMWMQLFLVAAMPFREDMNAVMREIYYDLNRVTLEEARTLGYL